MHTNFAIVNGSFLPSAEATVSIADRGFRFGDGAFETVSLIRGVPYQWEIHLQRLFSGLAALRIAPPVVDWQAMAAELIYRNRAHEGFLRIAISRGVGSRGYMPERSISPTWVIECLPAAPPPTAPYRLWLSNVSRPALAALPCNYKLSQGIGSTLALLDAHDHDCDEALMLSPDGALCEAASANLFWIQQNTLYTPALSTGCLAGTTRAAVMRLSPVPYQEVAAGVNSLASAEAIFLTNARLGAWPVALVQPGAQSLNADHPILTEICARLTADRESYFTNHAAEWSRA